jgi:erythromycin esterase-like protein
MKTLLITLIGVSTIGATLLAYAGPDWLIIEHGRTAKLARMQQAVAATSAANARASTGNAPNIVQTPGQNDQYAQMMKECTAMMKDAGHDMNVK